MAKNTDPRFEVRRFQGAPAPRKYSDEGRSAKAAEATRQACFEESAHETNTATRSLFNPRKRRFEIET